MAAKPTLPLRSHLWSPPPYPVPPTLSDTEVAILQATHLDPPRSPDAVAGKMAHLFPNLRSTELTRPAALWMAVHGTAWGSVCYALLTCWQPTEPLACLQMLSARAPEAPDWAKQASTVLYLALFFTDPDRNRPWHAVNKLDH
jgi:hypothetical protein